MQATARSARAFACVLTGLVIWIVPASKAAAGPVYIEPGPVEQAVRYSDGGIVQVETQTVWRPVCGGDPGALTVDHLRQIAQGAKARAAAHPLNMGRVAGGGSATFDLVFNVTTSLPAGALQALQEVEQYVEAQFSDPITVVVNFAFAPLEPNVLGATGSSYVTAAWPDARDGLQNGMDTDDSIQDFLPAGSSIPVRYNGNSATVTNESIVFVTRANYRATIGAVPGTVASITFSSNFPWDYDPSDGITGGTWCFQSVIIHEVGHALGFTSGADFRTNDLEVLDLFRFQRSDGSGTDHNPDDLGEFTTTARMVDRDAPGTDDDVNSDLITAEYRMADGVPNQASHFHDQFPPIGIMDPTIGSGQTFYPDFYRQPDLDMFDAIGYDYPLQNTSCDKAAEIPCNGQAGFNNSSLTEGPNPLFSCGAGSTHAGAGWFKFVATADSARISTCESLAADSTWAVYAGACGSLVEIACSEDGGCDGGGANGSICLTQLALGETYYLQLAAHTGADLGSYTVRIDCSCEGACCVPPPVGCFLAQESGCSEAGGSFVGGGTVCPADELEISELCSPTSAVHSQPVTGDEEDLESNVDWSDSSPNAVLAEQFEADGRPIHTVRWWGSVLDGAVPLDGWLVGFLEPQATGQSPSTALGVYFCGSESVSTEPTLLTSCDAESVLGYEANLADCCLVHSGPDSRTSEVPAQRDAFNGELCTAYELSIAASVGRRFDFDMGLNDCVESPTAAVAGGPFWGWHSSAVEDGIATPLAGPLASSGGDWFYGSWSNASAACGTANMAVELLTREPAGVLQIGADNGNPNDAYRLNSQFGGAISDWITFDDAEFDDAVTVTGIRWFNEESNPFSWSGRVRVEIYPDNGSGAPDESGGPAFALWVPDDAGTVTRTSLGAGTFFPRFEYKINDLDLPLGAGIWWFGVATAGNPGGGQAFWLTSRTSPQDGALVGGEAHFRTPSLGYPMITSWSELENDLHDVSFVITIAELRDCNCNGTPDYAELLGGAPDCDGNAALDECDLDCNENNTPDACEIGGAVRDCQPNGRLDECDLTYGTSFDADNDGVPDECDVCAGFDDFADADGDGVPDGCDKCPGFDDSQDTDLDTIPDPCDNCELPNTDQADCQPNDVGDICDVADAVSRDCNGNFVPDECEGVPSPQVPSVEPGGLANNRYLAFVPGNPGVSSAIRVKLSSLHHPDPPNLPQSPPPDFSGFEGQVRWVGPASECPDSTTLGTTFWCAKLQCDPVYLDWQATIGPDVLYVTGAEVIPSSMYDVQILPEACDGTAEPSYSAALQLSTARWGDVGEPLQEPSPASRSQPNVLDISAAVDKLKDVPTALHKPRIQLQENDPDPTASINVLEISFTVDAVKAAGYPFAGPSSCE